MRGRTERGKRALVVSMLVLLLMLLAACGQTPEPEPESPVEPPIEVEVIEPEPEEPEEVVEEEESWPFYHALTGIGSEEDSSLYRPVAYFVENSPAARPQSGLDKADIVYEVLAEGEITRFVAIFQSQRADEIGPVRSARPYLIQLGDGLDSLIVHAGWSQDAKNLLVSRRIQHFDAVYGDHPYYWRSKERKAPHNLYTNSEKILEGATAKKYRIEEWKAKKIPFLEKVDPMVWTKREQMPNVSISYLNGYVVQYDYDKESERYLRFMGKTPHVDKVSERQLAADNVIIIRAPHRVLDNQGRREVDVDGSGEGYLLQHGTQLEITWKMDEGVIRVYQDGQELAWQTGQTWVQIVPIQAEVKAAEPLEKAPVPSDKQDDAESEGGAKQND